MGDSGMCIVINCSSTSKQAYIIKYLLNEWSYGHFAYKNGFEINFWGDF